MTILDKIAGVAKERVQKAKQKVSLEEMKQKALELAKNDQKNYPFERALETEGISFICEVKKASPSKGIIAEDFPYVEIAKDYEKAGASCISVLTEPEFFMGSDAYLTEISQHVSIPIIRKDFVIDAYQIYEAKVIGASCVLLICSLLDRATLSEYLNICHELGLSALVEAHDEKEIEDAVAAGARIIGVNNRNLKTFEVDITNSVRLRGLVPRDILFVAESGIKTSDDIKTLVDAGVNAVLVGETLMRSPDKKKMLDTLKGIA